MSNFDPDAILRGAQLTLVGANRALQNPGIFKNQHYRQAAIAVVGGLAISLLVQIPVLFARASLWTVDLFTDLEAATWDDQVIKSLHFLQHSVLQVPFFLMSLIKYASPALDQMFMESLAWVDQTYYAKHKPDDPSKLRDTYYENLKLYESQRQAKSADEKRKQFKKGLTKFLARYGKKAGLSLSIYLLSFAPFIGKFVLPAASYWTFKNAVGPTPASIIFAAGLVLPKHALVRFLQTYFGSRSMMRELLDPYFSRIRFSASQKKQWFFDREGVLFGFGLAFFMMVKIPLIGVLVYGIAEASTAYLITKITDPPPPPTQAEAYKETQVRWTNKAKFLSLPLNALDGLNKSAPEDTDERGARALPTKQYS